MWCSSLGLVSIRLSRVEHGCLFNASLATHQLECVVVVLLLLLMLCSQDEVDSLGQSRSSNTDAGARRLLTELLIQFNRVAEEEGLYVFAATNRMQVCTADLSMLRHCPCASQEHWDCHADESSGCGPAVLRCCYASGLTRGLQHVMC